MEHLKYMKYHEKISINWPNLSQKSLKLVEWWDRRVMQYYTANAIFIGHTERGSTFQKPPSPSSHTSAYVPTSTTAHFYYVVGGFFLIKAQPVTAKEI